MRKESVAFLFLIKVIGHLYKILVRFHGQYNNYTCSALWKQHVNLLLQTFRSRKLGSSLVLKNDEDPSLHIESSAINLRGVSTKRNKYNTSLFSYLYRTHCPWYMTINVRFFSKTSLIYSIKRQLIHDFQFA